MRDQAVLTDAAFTALGKKMDVLSSRQTATGLERTTRATRGLGQEADIASRRLDSYNRKTKDADRSTSGFGGKLRLVTRGLKDFGGELFRLIKPGGMIVGIATAVGVAGQAVGALAGGLISLGPRIVDLTGLLAPAIAGATGLATSLLSIKSAFTQLGTAMKGGAAGMKAFREMGSAGRQVVGDLKAMRPIMLQLRQAATGGIFAGLHKSLLDVRRVLPSLQPMLRSYSKMLGGEIARGTARMTTPGFMGDIQNIMGQGRGVSRDLIRGILNLVSALRHVAVAAKPFTEWLSKTILGWTRFADHAAKAGRESGRLAAFFERTKESAKGLGGFVKDLWTVMRNLGRAARPLGDDLYRSMQKAAHGWAEITSTPQRRLSLIRDFNAMAGGLKAMANLAGELGKAIFRMGSTGGLEKTANNLTKMVAPLEKILTYFAEAFGPPAAKALADIANLLADLGSSAGPLVTILNLVSGVANGLDAIVRHLGPLKGLVGTLVGGLLTARLLQKIGLITVAWRGVTVAATQAAGAQVAAMGASTGRGVMLGPLLGGGRTRTGPGFFGALRAGGRAAPGFAGGAAGPAVPGAAAVMGRGALMRGAGAGLLRGAGLVAGRFILPLMAMQGIFGALTAGGGVRNRAWGGANAATGGLAGAIFDQGLNREQAAAKGMGAEYRGLQEGPLAGAQTIDRLNRSIEVLRIRLKELQGNTTDAGKAYRDVLMDEMKARQQLVVQMQAEAQERGKAQAAAASQDLGKLYQLLLKTQPRAVARQMTVDAGFRQLGRMSPGTPAGRAARAAQEQMLLAVGQTMGPAAYADVAGRVRAAEGGRVTTRGTRVFRGGFAERGGLIKELGTETERQRARDSTRLTGAELDLVASLEASGVPRPTAIRDVRAAQGRPGAIRRAMGGPGYQAVWTQQAKRFIRRRSLEEGFIMDQGDRFTRTGEQVLMDRGASAKQARAAMQLAYTEMASGRAPAYPAGKMDAATRRRFRRWFTAHGFAGGGRLPGSGFQDTVPAMLGPGEMVVNRHQESRVNQALASSGNTLEGITDATTRRHSESFAAGGRAGSATREAGKPPQSRGSTRRRADPAGSGSAGPGGGGGPMAAYGLKAGITNIGNAVLTRYPGLSVTSTTTGNHAANSYHYKGMAIDIGGAVDTMHNAAVWISRKLGAGLLEGIHNTGLSVKNGANVKPGFWGASTWSGHRDHIHLAAGAGGTGAAAGVATGAGAAGARRRPPRPAGSIASIFGGGGTAGLFGVGGIQFSPGSGSGGGGGGGGGTAPTSAPGGGTNRQIGKRMMLAAGWGAGQWPALNTLWTGESGWRTTADNPSSDAYGIPQSLPGSKMASKGADWKTNPRTQIAWGLDYIKGRYGSPSAALSAWNARSPHWYAKGGRTPRWGGWHQLGMDRTFDTPTMIGVGEKGSERVQVTPTGKGGGGQPVTINAHFTIHGGEAGRVKREVEQAMSSFAQKLEQLGYHGGDE